MQGLFVVTCLSRLLDILCFLWLKSLAVASPMRETFTVIVSEDSVNNITVQRFKHIGLEIKFFSS